MPSNLPIIIKEKNDTLTKGYIELKVDYKGAENNYNFRLLIHEATYKLHVDLNGKVMEINPETDKDFRALFYYAEAHEKNRNFDDEFLLKMANLVEELVGSELTPEENA